MFTLSHPLSFLIKNATPICLLLCILPSTLFVLGLTHHAKPGGRNFAPSNLKCPEDKRERAESPMFFLYTMLISTSKLWPSLRCPIIFLLPITRPCSVNILLSNLMLYFFDQYFTFPINSHVQMMLMLLSWGHPLRTHLYSSLLILQMRN